MLANRVYREADDYEDIKEYIEQDEDDFEVPFERPEFKIDYGAAIIVDGLPIANESKLAKMKGVLVDIYTNLGTNVTLDDLHVPIDPTTSCTQGFCFIRLASGQEATLCQKRTDGQPFGSKNILRVSLYSNLIKLANLSDEYQPVKPPPFVPRPDPTSWLCDPNSKDQFLSRYGTETKISWGTIKPEDEIMVVPNGDGEIHKKYREGSLQAGWCQSSAFWSPMGTYMAAYHKNGMLLYGGANFLEVARFEHKLVDFASFSPCENYIVTYRLKNQMGNGEDIGVWDVRTGKAIRRFNVTDNLGLNFQVLATVTESISKGKNREREHKGHKDVDRMFRGRITAINPDGSFNISENSALEHINVPREKVAPMQDPNCFKWSADGKYLAKLMPDLITVFELPSMRILESKSIPAAEVLEFSWSPGGENLISYYTPASSNKPAVIGIIRIPSREVICSRKVVNVIEANMVWQEGGDYLGVYMTKESGKDKTYPLMFFRIKSPSVPVELLTLSENVKGMSWEPNGERVVIICGEPGNATLHIYSLGTFGKGKEKKTELHLLQTLTGKKCTNVQWSPAGGVIAITNKESDGIAFELYDVQNSISMASRRHNKAKELLWDPSGRTLATATSRTFDDISKATILDDGFNIYTFQGVPLVQEKRPRQYQFSWRPRPKNLLTPEEKKHVVKNLKLYQATFEKEDRERKNVAFESIISERKMMANSFLARLARRRQEQARSGLRATRIQLRDGYDSDDESNYETKIVYEERVISKKESVVH